NKKCVQPKPYAQKTHNSNCRQTKLIIVLKKHEKQEHVFLSKDKKSVLFQKNYILTLFGNFIVA
ncbi:MAG: hypothetical protein Q4C99_09155, partial [Clostridia bacterium]|nr:hypothetical protein [Clostridia bacterium]